MRPGRATGSITARPNETQPATQALPAPDADSATSAVNPLTSVVHDRAAPGSRALSAGEPVAGKGGAGRGSGRPGVRAARRRGSDGGSTPDDHVRVQQGRARR